MTDVNYTITISGPAETFTDQILLIKQVLTDAGYAVKVEDAYPRNSSDETDDEYINRIKLARKGKNLLFKQDNILIKANHCPWGG
jgi:hypothetical protein